MPGDLVFWSDGGEELIHHVAIFIGGGNVIQAPQSGDIVRITPLGQVSPGYYGATRPMT
jgi:peptidoglycan DL-endopeptidase RipA